jgi:MFS family permease
MRPIVLKYGFIAGAILAVAMLGAQRFSEQIGFERAATVGYTSMVAAFAMIFFGIRTHRDRVLGGAISFWQAMRVGALISLVATLCYVATWQFVYYRLAPDFTEKYAAYALDKARAEGASPEALAKTEREMKEFGEMYKKPLVNIGFTFLEPLPVALLITLVSAGGLSRKRPPSPVRTAATTAS